MTAPSTERKLLSTLEMPAAAHSAEFLIRSRSEIVRVLADIMQRRVPVSVHFSDGGPAAFSAVVDIDESSGTLFRDCPPEWQVGIDAQSSASVMLVCADDEAKLQFQGGAAKVVHFGGRTVASMPLPTFLWRFQRRSDARYRIPPPPLKIVLNLGVLESEGEIADLSMSGLGLINCDSDVNLKPGETLRGCAITRPGVGRIAVDLQVRYRSPLRMSDGSSIMRIGCQFTGLNADARQLMSHYLEALTQR